jgi:hypothetical protein
MHLDEGAALKLEVAQVLEDRELIGPEGPQGVAVEDEHLEALVAGEGVGGEATQVVVREIDLHEDPHVLEGVPVHVA